MGIFGTRRIKRVAPGRYRISIPEPEQQLLRSLIPQLRDLLSTDDPSLVRLFPTAYPDDPERDAGYHAMVRDELLERRFSALDALERTLEGGEVGEEELSAWMRALNDLRLVLGTRLDVSEDDDPADLDPEDPDAPAWTIYHYLGALQSMVVDALTQDL
jgi:hypothetical protein